MRCPKCGIEYDRLLALSRRDNQTMICDTCGTMEALEDLENYQSGIKAAKKKLSPYERTKQQVHVSGNKWAIENFEAAHN